MVERGLTPNFTTYNIMLKGYFRAGQINEAWDFFLKMKKRKCEIDVVTYATVIHGLGVAGEIKSSKGEMQRALAFTERMKYDECKANVQTYNILIRYFCDSGEIENGLDLFQKMGTEDCLPNMDTYNILISAMFVRAYIC
ncbi:hypothetical protein GH714_024126 [Hevea brasiliensis]|uniref:Pentacotripeptide-repeat region of PRORP domain-containing protein n=1 Tax=Hevea brasiliensis TaxID=3981 RepID=A0A6A6LP90_HEVBR|nr:hypothetical protein GH714_024126 [Hevea brasiliensis]